MINHDKILVTGSSKGIGLAITKKILEQNIKVVGISKETPQFYGIDENYFHFNIDFSNLHFLEQSISQVLKEHPEISAVINNAGYGKFSNIENFSSKQIQAYINMNLISHIIVTSVLLPHLKRRKAGNIIFIGSEAALSGSKKGSLYCAAKFGLRGFCQSIREESCDKDVGISLINPGMVRTSFFDGLTFVPGDKPENAVEPQDIADLVITILRMRQGTVLDEINLSPMKKVLKFF